MLSGKDPGERALQFIGRLTHTGDYSGKPFALRPWQAEPIRKLFGTLRPGTNLRQYRKTFWALPRKQGKTELVAAGSLYLLMGQGRPNQRIFTASGDTEQAALIFNAACEMIANDPVLSDRTIVYPGGRRIEFPEGRSTLKVLSSVPKSKHGLGPTAVLIDELHVVPELLVNVLTTGFGARLDPLTWYITTAGHDRHSLCWDEWEYAEKVRDGVVDDPTYLPVIYAAGKDEDWHSEAVWHKAMPALGDFCQIDYIREEHQKAVERPRFENTFRQLYLNQWTEQADRWLSVDRWQLCATLDPSTLAGRECVAGLDLGVTGDMSSLQLAFPNDRKGVDVRSRYWVPDKGKWRFEKHNVELYKLWEKAGHLTFTPGEAQDFDQIETDILEENRLHPFRLVLADRAYASMMLNRLQNVHGLKIQGIPQGPKTLNEAMVFLETCMLKRTLRHDGHPVLTWNVANANIRKDSFGLIYLDKSSDTARIDGLAALIDALVGLMSSPDQRKASVYETRGVRTA
jgi:phage terminase large subunit-like protein